MSAARARLSPNTTTATRSATAACPTSSWAAASTWALRGTRWCRGASCPVYAVWTSPSCPSVTSCP
jgi:hypothetical protein